MEAQRKLVSTLESTVAALTAEVAELRKNALEQASKTNGNDVPESWSTVVKRGKKRNLATTNRNSVSRDPEAKTTGLKRSSNATPPAGRKGNLNNGEANKPVNSWKRVSGARKVWGTLKTCSVATVKSAISRFCNNSTVKIKRKFKANGAGGQSHWWFVLHDTEEALVSLESNWERLALQTSWKLMNCYMPQPSNLNDDNESEHVSDTTAVENPPNNEPSQGSSSPDHQSDAESGSGHTPKSASHKNSFLEVPASQLLVS